jgi:Crinkler effector protein N-terminal domain
VSSQVALFPIEIESSKPVGILKDKIKTAAADKFASIGSRHLNLYHVEISVHDDITKAVELKLSQDPSSVGQAAALGEISQCF